MSVEAPRRGIVQVFFSPRAGQAFEKHVLAPGEQRTLGRDERATLRLADADLKGAHAELFFDGVALHVRAVRGAGAPSPELSIDGEAKGVGEVRSGGWLSAGHSTLRFYLEGRTPPARDRAPHPGAAAVAARLRPAAEAGHLYGLFDAARSDRVLVTLAEGVDEHASLYLGIEGRTLDEVAPYLVRFRADSQLLERVLAAGWGDAWGVFVSSSAAPKDVRRHFRRFLKVEEDETREPLYFRFYDPRVWREFWKVATPRQRSELTAGLDWVGCESEEGTWLSFGGAGGALASGPEEEGDAAHP